MHIQEFFSVLLIVICGQFAVSCSGVSSSSSKRSSDTSFDYSKALIPRHKQLPLVSDGNVTVRIANHASTGKRAHFLIEVLYEGDERAKLYDGWIESDTTSMGIPRNIAFVTCRFELLPRRYSFLVRELFVEEGKNYDLYIELYHEPNLVVTTPFPYLGFKLIEPK